MLCFEGEEKSVADTLKNGTATANDGVKGSLSQF